MHHAVDIAATWRCHLAVVCVFAAEKAHSVRKDRGDNLSKMSLFSCVHAPTALGEECGLRKSEVSRNMFLNRFLISPHGDHPASHG